MEDLDLQLRVTEWTVKGLFIKFYYFIKTHPLIKMPPKLVSKTYKFITYILMVWTQLKALVTVVQ
jgi:hypothetical protein